MMGTGSSQTHKINPSKVHTDNDERGDRVRFLPCLGRDRVDIEGTSSSNDRPSEQEVEDDIPYDPGLEPVISLTDEEKHLLTHSWKHVERDADRIGTVTFTILFEKHPEIKNGFEPQTVDTDVDFNKVLRNHGLRVLYTVGKMIHRLTDEKKMADVVIATGTRHGGYKAKAPLIDVMCPHFVRAISETLGDMWTPELESAYNHLFALLVYHMKGTLMTVQYNKALKEKKS